MKQLLRLPWEEEEWWDSRGRKFKANTWSERNQPCRHEAANQNRRMWTIWVRYQYIEQA